MQKQQQQAERMQTLTRPAEGMTDLTAKMGVDMDYNSRPVSFKGRLRMRYNEVIQVSFTAFGLMEIASLEVRPDVVYIIDRVNKKYVGCAGEGRHQFCYHSGALLEPPVRTRSQHRSRCARCLLCVSVGHTASVAPQRARLGEASFLY